MHWIGFIGFLISAMVIVDATPLYSDGDLMNGKTETDWTQLIVGIMMGMGVYQIFFRDG